MEEDHQHIKLTSAELSYLWSTYIADSMSVCILTYFLEHIEDEDITSVTTHALDLSKQHVKTIEAIFIEEGVQIPQGFTEKDVNLEAKRLFSDFFYIRYINNMAKGGLVTYGRILQNVFRQDIHSFFAKCLTSTIELKTEATKVLLHKGISVRPPTIPYPQEVEFIKKQSFFLEGLGRREALTGTEVTNLYANTLTNHLGVSMATAFSQVAKSDKVRKIMLRGKEIALKHIEVFRSYLEMHSLPTPMAFDQEVTDSQQAPFSDKLMLFHFGLMIYAGIGNYGVAISESQRSDLLTDYTRLTAEIVKFSEDGTNMMIANKWLEQPPLATNRHDLSKK
ncbi:DUF3231 family protein [Ferdinandcohnia sp. Marseille-Q9671]